jgi:chromate transporter
MRGAICTALGTALPSFLIILLIAMFFNQFEDNATVQAMFRGIRPAVVALIAAPTFSLAKTTHINLANCWIPIGGALLIWAMHVNPIWIIIAAGLGGYIYGLFVNSDDEQQESKEQ